MARRCQITGKGALVGNNVSHANNKTKRRFLPNLQETSLMSDVLGTAVRLRLTVTGLRPIDKNGGLDAWLSTPSATQMTPAIPPLKRRIARCTQTRQAAAGPRVDRYRQAPHKTRTHGTGTG